MRSRFFDAIQSVDRPKLAEVLAHEMAKQKRRPDLYVQVNTGDESQKAGIAVGEADDFIRRCRDDLKLPVVGLMCIPPVEADPKPHFRLLAEIAERNGLSRLSMGMSGDYEAAIACGATDVRVGSAIFGVAVVPIDNGRSQARKAPGVAACREALPRCSQQSAGPRDRPCEEKRHYPGSAARGRSLCESTTTTS